MFGFVLYTWQLAPEEKHKHPLLYISDIPPFFLWQLKYLTQIKDPRQTHNIVIVNICEELQTPTWPFIIKINKN